MVEFLFFLFLIMREKKDRLCVAIIYFRVHRLKNCTGSHPHVVFGSLCTRWCRCLWLAQTGIHTAVGERGIGMKVREGVPVLNNRTDVSGFRKSIHVSDKIMTRENTARERITMHSLASQRPAGSFQL